MANAAIIGDNKIPKTGYRRPAATGIPKHYIQGRKIGFSSPLFFNRFVIHSYYCMFQSERLDAVYYVFASPLLFFSLRRVPV